MKIPNNPDTFAAVPAIQATWEENGYRRFGLTGRTDIISCEILQNDILAYPERSSAHKALVSALGLNEGSE